jgi:hypothetical protein
VPDFYRHALRRLARAGLRPEPWETAREFAARVAAARPESATPFGEITRAYERVRFGGARLAPAESQAVGSAAAGLA